MPTSIKTLILGGARSGKSQLAEDMAKRGGREVHYVATAEIWDEEMRQRVLAHQAQRPEHWPTHHAPNELTQTLVEQAHESRCLLVDCLTLWLSNQLLRDDEVQRQKAISELLEALPSLPGQILLVSNEVGLGIVPEHPLGRRFRDEAGRLHQRIASLCDQVIFTVSGMPLVMKAPGYTPPVIKI